MDAASLQVLYRERFSGHEVYRNQVWEILVRNFFQRWIKDTDRVADLGAGYCEFINNVRAASRIAIDLNPECSRYAAPGVEVVAHDVCRPWPVKPESLDVIFTSNFFEHLPSKQALAECVSQIRTSLAPGGRLIAMGPNIRYCSGYWDFFDHHIALTELSLQELLRSNGFSNEKVVPKFLPYTMVGKKPNLLLVRLYLKMPFIWRVMGQQFLVIARKS